MTGPKFTTPASGVRAKTERTIRAETEEADRLDRLHGGREDEDTPVGSPALARIGERTKSLTTSASDIQTRVGRLEGDVANVRVDIAALSTEVSGLDGKLEVLVTESQHTRREREEREKRAELRAEADANRQAEAAKAELAFRRDRMLKIIAIVVPTIAALGALVAAIVSAYNSSGA